MTFTAETAGIGTLNEHSLHAFLKSQLENNPANCEVKVGRYIADIVNDSGIIEIQTRGFSSLRPKLCEFLKENHVTVVYPIADRKRLIWIDPKTGETTKPRLSPKRGKAFDVCAELVYIKNQLISDNLSFKILLLDIDEYRMLNGWSKDKKKGSTRKDCVPLEITQVTEINETKDFSRLVPETLPDCFTTTDFKKLMGRSGNFTSRFFSVMSYTGAIEKCGKKGRSFLYKRI